MALSEFAQSTFRCLHYDICFAGNLSICVSVETLTVLNCSTHIACLCANLSSEADWKTKTFVFCCAENNEWSERDAIIAIAITFDDADNLFVQQSDFFGVRSAATTPPDGTVNDEK